MRSFGAWSFTLIMCVCYGDTLQIQTYIRLDHDRPGNRRNQSLQSETLLLLVWKNLRNKSMRKSIRLEIVSTIRQIKLQVKLNLQAVIFMCSVIDMLLFYVLLNCLKDPVSIRALLRNILAQAESFINVSSYEWRQIVASASLAQPLARRLFSRNPDNIHLQQYLHPWQCHLY